MFQPSIAVIRAVHSDRIRRDVIARHRPGIAPRESIFRIARRSVGRAIVRVGAAIASETSDGWLAGASPPSSVSDCR